MDIYNFFLIFAIKLTKMSEVINKNCGIYKITSPSGKIYIGQSKDIKTRWNSYHNLSNSIKGQKALYKSFVKYDVKNHQFDVIEYCRHEDLNCSERFWQDIFNVTESSIGLNCILVECGEKKKETSNNKEVVNTLTGEEYRSNRICAKINNISESNLSCKLRGIYTNDTPFIYKKDLHLKDTRVNQVFKGKDGKNNPNYGKRGELNTSSKKVICTKTGKIWNSVRECAEENHINKTTLSSWLCGLSPNKSTFKYLN